MNKKFNGIYFGNEVTYKMGNVSLRKTAKEIGISPATLCRITNGKEPDISTYYKICAWLNHPMEKYFIRLK